MPVSDSLLLQACLAFEGARLPLRHRIVLVSFPLDRRKLLHLRGRAGGAKLEGPAREAVGLSRLDGCDRRRVTVDDGRDLLDRGLGQLKEVSIRLLLPDNMVDVDGGGNLDLGRGVDVTEFLHIAALITRLFGVKKPLRLLFLSGRRHSRHLLVVCNLERPHHVLMQPQSYILPTVDKAAELARPDRPAGRREE